MLNERRAPRPPGRGPPAPASWIVFRSIHSASMPPNTRAPIPAARMTSTRGAGLVESLLTPGRRADREEDRPENRAVPDRIAFHHVDPPKPGHGQGQSPPGCRTSLRLGRQFNGQRRLIEADQPPAQGLPGPIGPDNDRLALARRDGCRRHAFLSHGRRRGRRVDDDGHGECAQRVELHGDFLLPLRIGGRPQRSREVRVRKV